MAANDPQPAETSMDNHEAPEQEESLPIPVSGGEGSPKDDDHHVPSNDWDFYGTDLEVEDLIYYDVGGYCPVLIGDIFEHRYKVIHKLGHGGSGTVWLARDSNMERYVALKILCAELSAEWHDVKMSSYLREESNDHPGRQYIALILDHFEFDSPNGKHLW